MPVKLGPLQIENPFALAPMAGSTDAPFRRLMRRHRCALVVSEMVSANGIEYEGAKTFDLMKYHEEERPIGLQIFGEREDYLVKAAQVVERLGADFVDLNAGCPVPKVVKKGAGSAMMRDPAALGRILTAMVKAVKIPVSLKIRVGWDSSTRNGLEVVRAAEAAGVAWVAIHGRTRAQGYSGQVDWDFIGEAKAKSKVPIIGNGDVITAQEAVDRLRTYGVDAVMIGRGVLKNPFLFAEAEALWKNDTAPVLGQKARAKAYVGLLQEQRNLLEETYGPPAAMIQARKFLAWYAVGLPGCHEFRRRVFVSADPNTLWNEAINFFQGVVESP